MKTRAVQFILLCCLSAALFAAQPRRGWTKLELSPAPGHIGGIPRELLHAFGAEPMAEYATRAVIYAPAGAVESIRNRATELRVFVRRRDDMDVLHLPSRAVVDTREGIGPDVPNGKLTSHYPPGKPGLFVLQFTAPPRAEWVSELQSMGWTLSRYIPYNAYIAIGKPELTGATRRLSYVQWVDFFHPYQKWMQLPRGSEARVLMFELASSPDPAEAIEHIRARANGAVRIERSALDTLVYASMPDADAEALLEDPLIISVSVAPEGFFSDERVSMSLTSNVTTDGSQPTTPTGYWSWVLSRCPNCSSMAAADWKIGIADTGLDTGLASVGHPDLNGRKFFGGRFYTGPDETCASGSGYGLNRDCYSHGTMVAGIAAGDGTGTGLLDQQGGYRIGTGVAPAAGIFGTKVFSANSGANIDLTRVGEFTNDAAVNGVTIQNHSFNEYYQSSDLDVSGIYSALARRYDILVRDADETMTAPLRPLLITVSAGNRDQGYQGPNRFRVLAGATAKNVLAMGGAESYRPQYTSCRGGSRADDFRNIMATSRTGTLMPGYIKPDLVAPASMAVGTHPTPIGSVGYCASPFENNVRTDGGPLYSMESGTSFAAPVGAGAAMLVKRYLGATPAAISPALTKAVLIAGARSIRGGVDRSGGGLGATVGPAPNGQQGFGRISLDDILTGANPPVVLDQSTTRLFNNGGQVYRMRLRVRDASKPVKVALVWTDAPGTAGAGTDNPLVNNIDLSVEPHVPGNTIVYLGNSLQVNDPNRGEESIAYTAGEEPRGDYVNNVEYARFFLPQAGTEFDVMVTSASIAGNTDANLSTHEQDFALAIVNADPVNNGNPIAPKLTASVNHVPVNGTVHLQWEPALNMLVDIYDVYRGDDINHTTSPMSTQFEETIAIGTFALNKGYAFRVVARGSAGESVPSNYDFVAMMDFAYATTPETRPIPAAEFNELRTGIDYIRAAALLPVNTWAEPIGTTTIIRASHMNELRDKLEEALNPYGAPLPTYTYPDPVANVSLPHQADTEDLRLALRY